jgi:hypothetical protein
MVESLKVCVCGTGDDVDQGTQDWEEQNEDRPSGFRPTMMIAAAEVVDKTPDNEEDHEEYASEDEHGPEQTQERIGVREHFSSESIGRAKALR